MRKLLRTAVLPDRFEVISATEFRANPGDVFDSVQLGKVFVITKRGRPIAVISKPPGETLAIAINTKGQVSYEPVTSYKTSVPPTVQMGASE